MKKISQKMKNLFKITYAQFILGSVFLFNSNFVKADANTGNNGSLGGLSNPISANSIPAFLASILTAATEIGTIVGALSIMYGGFLFATAQGDEEKISTAKKTITWALVGTAVLIGAQVIITVVSSTVSRVTS